MSSSNQVAGAANQIETAVLLRSSRNMQLFMQQFFDAIGDEQKARLWARDRERLAKYRAQDDYGLAFEGDPLVSIIVPTYNRLDVFLGRTLPSVLAQTYPHWELIIVGDVVDADQAMRLERVAGLDPRISFYNLKTRAKRPSRQAPRWYVGGIKPINFGLRVARGRWISHLDDDDVFHPEHIESLLRQAQQNRKEWVHARVRFIGDNGNDQGEVGAPMPAHGAISRISSIYHACLKGFRYNLECWRYCCPFDWDLWSRLLEMGAHHGYLDQVTAIHYGDYSRVDALIEPDRRGDRDARTVTYPEWSAEFKLSDALRQRVLAAPALPKISILILAHEAKPGELDITLSSLAAQSYLSSRIDVVGCAQAGLPMDAYREPGLYCHADELEPGWHGDSPAWLWVMQAGDRLAADALLICAEQLSKHSACEFWYVDENRLHQAMLADPVFKPDVNPDLLRSYPYIGATALIHPALFADLSSAHFREQACWAVELAYRQLESRGRNGVGHIAECLYQSRLGFAAWVGQRKVIQSHHLATLNHFKRRGVPVQIEAGRLPVIQRIRYLHQARPLVSIIIPTKDQFVLIAGLVESLASKTGYDNYELLIVDNGSTQPEARNYLDGLERLANARIRIVRYPQVFNYSAMNNYAASQARGDYLVLLNNDTVIVDGDWLAELLNHAQRPEVGVVGAKLFYPDGRIQHGGVILGLNGPAEHPFLGKDTDAGGYMDRLHADQNYSAVTAACLMIRRSVFEQIGGLDADQLTVSYNDVDLCLKAGQAGYLVVWTPYAKLVHHGSVSQRSVDEATQAAKERRFKAEQDVMYQRWLPLMANDPAYNKNLDLDLKGFELDPHRHIAWQPFASPVVPRVVCHPADATGCGHYRIRQPFRAMQAAGLVDGTITEMLLNPVILERFQAQSIVLQRQHTEAQRQAMRRYRGFSKAFMVYELDDYMLNLPMKSLHREHMPKDVQKSLREAVAITDRFVVSTDCLAESFASFHSDIRVVKNRLPVDWWSGLKAERRIGPRPRVGWGGGAGHTGDLELIADVVRELAGEVDWIFFGLCPEKLKPYIKEYHVGVPIADYPAKLASLNLDLALAPLEDNLFNACKSNLRLLEYGACGFPVICSDLVTYREPLPVTRVKNRYKDWVQAIRMHLSDLDASEAHGDRLREAVLKDWMLTEPHLHEWRDTWLP